MHIGSSGEALRTPERLDARFGVVAGLYVAALLSPALSLVAVDRLQLRSGPLALGLLAAVGAVLTAVVAWQVTRRGGLVAWFDSTWLAWLVPAVGVLPMIAYFVPVIEYIGLALTELEAESAASLIGVTGFVLGIVAWCLGGALVLMARDRLVTATIGDADVDIEWTAGWTRRDWFNVVVGTLVVGVPLFGLLVWYLREWAINIVSAVGMLLLIGIYSLVSKRTYRVTPAGVEQYRGGTPFASRQFTSWSQFEGFSVTDRAIVLHRQPPHLDVRCSRRDLIPDDEDVIAALEAHLDRRDS